MYVYHVYDMFVYHVYDIYVFDFTLTFVVVAVGESVQTPHAGRHVPVC